MLTPEQQERLEVIRRIAERGKALSESLLCSYEPAKFLDIFVHILDELKRIA